MRIRALLPVLFAAVASAQEKPTPEDETRAGAWHIAVAIVSQIEKTDTKDFPGLRSWLKDFHAVHAKRGEGEATKAFRPVDSDALVTRNPNWWAAFYEIAPGDPAVLSLHGLLLLAGGEPQRAQQLAAIGIQRPGIPDLHRQALRMVMNESQKAMARANETTHTGVRLHDARDYDGAIKKYDEALALNPSNGWTHYERGFSIRIRAYVKAGRPVPENGQFIINGNDADLPEEKDVAADFAQARLHDPFQFNAYQGSDKKVIASILPLHEKIRPVWEQVMQDATKPLDDGTLLKLAEGCHEVGIHDYALVTRQILIARRKRYAPEDHPIISEHLRALAAGPVVERTIKQLAGEKMRGLMFVPPEGDAGLLLAPPGGK